MNYSRCTFNDKFILKNEVNEMKHVYSARESITVQIETGFDKLSHFCFCVVLVLRCRAVLYIDSKRVLQSRVYKLYTVVVLHDNVPTN